MDRINVSNKVKKTTEEGYANGKQNICRRSFLKCTISGILIAAFYPTVTFATLSSIDQALIRKRRLQFQNTHTGETLNLSLSATNEPLSIEQLDRVNHIFRDFRENEVYSIDPKLLIQLIRIQNSLNTDTEIQIVSGYRSPLTNHKLRSKPGNRVAKKSFHMLGKAVDFRLKGIPLRDVRAAALALKAGGVGYYPSDNFVHIDTGSVRSW